MVKKHQTTCCAFAIITANNEDSLSDIKRMVDKTKRESKEYWHYTDRESGERTLACFVTYNENVLEKNLKLLNFKFMGNIPRRNGYLPNIDNKLYLLSW